MQRDLGDGGCEAKWLRRRQLRQRCASAQPDFGRSPRLLPTLHATEVLDCGEIDSGREYDYTARDCFKIRGKTVARPPEIAGHADATRQRLALAVERSTRRTILAAARRAGARRVTLTLVYRLTQTVAGAGDWSGEAYRSEAFLTIPWESSRAPGIHGLSRGAQRARARHCSLRNLGASRRLLDAVVCGGLTIPRTGRFPTWPMAPLRERRTGLRAGAAGGQPRWPGVSEPPRRDTPSWDVPKSAGTVIRGL